MAVIPHRGSSGFVIDFAALSIELAGIDPTKVSSLGDKIVQTIATHLDTDRVSLLLFERRGNRIEGAYSVGFNISLDEISKSRVIINYVLDRKKPIIVYDINEHDELRPQRQSNYRTDGFAVFPLMCGRRTLGMLCISNMSSQQLMQLENYLEGPVLMVSQISQMCSLIKKDKKNKDLEFVCENELQLIDILISNLERCIDTSNVFATFGEVISKHMNVDMLVMVHDRMHESPRGVVVPQRPVHNTELTQVFEQIADAWQRRHRRSPSITRADAMVINSELVQMEGECPDELRLQGIDTIPIFIDNDLFALVGLASDDETLADQHTMQLFSILAHQLMMHLKKGLLMEQNQQMQTVDTLTGLYNERHFYQMLEREFERAARYNIPLCMLIIDVDHFKDVNETYGFETGDMLLKELSRIIMENTRNTDLVSRYSGERFIVALPETHYKNGEILGNRLRRFIENHSFVIPNTNVFIKATVSIGVASFLDHKPAALAQFIEFADTALYFAKRNGRNQVVGYSFVIDMMMRDTSHES